MNFYSIIQEKQKSLRSQIIDNSIYSHMLLSKDDPSYREVQRYYGHEHKCTFGCNILEEKSENKKTGLKKLICSLEYEINAGDYIVYPNKSGTPEYWIVVYIQDDEITKEAFIQQCNYNTKWIDSETYQVIEYPSVYLKKNSYSSGIWGNFYGFYVDGEVACIMPFVGDTKILAREKRFLIDNNSKVPTSYRITKIENIFNIGVLALNLEEDEPDDIYDDYENMVAEYFKYDINFELVLEDIKINSPTTLHPELKSINRVNGMPVDIENLCFEYSVLDSDICSVDEYGNLFPKSIGNTFITVSCYIKDRNENIDNKYNNQLKTIEVEVVDTSVEISKSEIQGERLIYFNSKNKYKVLKLIDNVEISQDYVFKVMDKRGIEITYMNELVTLIKTSNNEVILHVHDYIGEIELIASSNGEDIRCTINIME